jgi:hypothetical protein
MLAFAPKYNSEGKRDANEFKREARKWCKEHGGTLFLFDNKLSMKKRREQVLAAIALGESPYTVAFFCHGWSSGIQAGFRKNDDLACLRGATHVLLFACSCATGKNNGENSFAKHLRDATAAEVWAHATRGHTTRNPHVIVFEADSVMGGYYPVPCKSEYWSEWIKQLRKGLWLKFHILPPYSMIV